MGSGRQEDRWEGDLCVSIELSLSGPGFDLKEQRKSLSCL